MTDFYQRIGQQAVKLAPGPFLKLLLYSEAQNGGISADVFFQVGFDRVVRYRCAPPELTALIQEFWENGDGKVRPRSWAAMRFWIEGGEVRMHLIYPEDLRPGEYLDRRPRVVADYFPLAEVDYSKPDGGGDGESPHFAAFLEGSMEGLRLQIEGHQNTWQFGREERWDFDQNSGELIFTFPDKIAKAPAQIIGSFDSKTSTWLWAWANKSIAGALKRDALRVLEFGTERGIVRLTTAKREADEMESWRMTALANRICSSNGAYRGPVGATLVFMTFGEVQLAKRA